MKWKEVIARILSLAPGSVAQPRVFREFHPEVGEYTYYLVHGFWSQKRTTTTGQEYRLTGRGQHPTPTQVDLWRELDVRLPKLIDESLTAIPPPPLQPEQFRHDSLRLYEVRLESDHTVQLFFNAPPVDDLIHAGPQTVFSAWRLVGTHWVP